MAQGRRADLARPELIAADDSQYHVGQLEARAFIAALMRRLRLDGDYAIPAYEDVWYYLWKERRLPVNVDPLRSNLDEPEERERLARVFEPGAGRGGGLCAPLAARPRRGTVRGGRAGDGFCGRTTCFSFPATRRWVSGCRWTRSSGRAADDREEVIQRDPLEPRGPLPSLEQRTLNGDARPAQTVRRRAAAAVVAARRRS